ncbi:LPXTG cell wall anchor domain-containing protein [Streptococcus entericus]|uniref:LPXTG cell wall anchor domain-containing protein n=1 Tax=Streptococcus entericus TaxID=155680 RepID=UPI000381F0B2|nr:LPXTG cell wall anchor domain-containing protein [Streptococcus entericus]
MKKLLKYGVASLSLATLGVVATATDVPFIGSTIVKADEANTSIISVSYTGFDPQDYTFFAELGRERYFDVPNGQLYRVDFPDFPGYTFDRWVPASELDTASNGGGSTQFAEFIPEGGVHGIFAFYSKEPLNPAPVDPKPTTPATPPTDNSGGADVQDQTPPADNNTGGGTGAETTTPPTDSSTGGTGTDTQTPPAENSDQGSGSESQTPPSDDEDNTSVTSPATQADKEDLSATRNQLLAQVDQSRLTDEQKGELAANIAFAETAEELDKLKSELTSLTANQSAPASADKPTMADNPAPTAAKTLPTTGELTTEALTAMGLSLVLFSLGLAKARKTK